MSINSLIRERGTRFRTRLVAALVSLGDKLTKKTDLTVFRTFPDFDAQGTEVARAMLSLGSSRLVWLSDGSGAPQSWSPDIPVVSARSWQGVWTLWRAGVVVHTHGVYGGYRPSQRKVLVNVWHGMPIKRLVGGSAVGRHQSTFTIATSGFHADHLAQTWNLPRSRVHCTGLPRNDALLRSAARRKLPSELGLQQGDRLVLWLPTYRNSALGDIRNDGHDAGNVFQLAGATAPDVDAMARRLGVHLVVKPHPMAENRSLVDYPNLSVWDEPALRKRFDSLYDLLGQADVLVTDHSSVWVDFLLLRRPIVFAIGDMDEYARTRGFYVAPDMDFLPGQVINSLEGLEDALALALAAGPSVDGRSTLR